MWSMIQRGPTTPREQAGSTTVSERGSKYQVASTGTFLDLATLQARTETENISQVLTVAGIGLTDPFNTMPVPISNLPPVHRH